MMKKIILVLGCICIASFAKGQVPLSFNENRKFELNYTLQSRSGFQMTWNSTHMLNHFDLDSPTNYKFRSDYGFKMAGGQFSMFAENLGNGNYWNARRNIGFSYGFKSATTSVEFQFMQRQRSDMFLNERGTDLKLNLTTRF